MEHQGPVSDV